jgi:hypothetical protein
MNSFQSALYAVNRGRDVGGKSICSDRPTGFSAIFLSIYES